MLAALTSPDYTWDITKQFYWSYGEVNVGILCASVPALKPFAKRHLAGVFGSSQRYQVEGGNRGLQGGEGSRSGSGSEAIMLRVKPKRAICENDGSIRATCVVLSVEVVLGGDV